MVLCVGSKSIGRRKGGSLFYTEKGTEKTFTGPRTRTEMLVVYSYCGFTSPELFDALKQNCLKLANTREMKMYGATWAPEVTPDEWGTWHPGSLFLVTRIAA